MISKYIPKGKTRCEKLQKENKLLTRNQMNRFEMDCGLFDRTNVSECKISDLIQHAICHFSILQSISDLTDCDFCLAVPF